MILIQSSLILSMTASLDMLQLTSLGCQTHFWHAMTEVFSIMCRWYVTISSKCRWQTSTSHKTSHIHWLFCQIQPLKPWCEANILADKSLKSPTQPPADTSHWGDLILNVAAVSPYIKTRPNLTLSYSQVCWLNKLFKAVTYLLCMDHDGYPANQPHPLSCHCHRDAPSDNFQRIWRLEKQNK